MEKEPITLNGLNNLKEELVFLKEKKRPEIVAAIAEARSHGDLKENAEYHAAKEEQSHTEGRITEINDISSLYFESELLVIIIWYQIKIKPIGIMDWANHEGINGAM